MFRGNLSVVLQVNDLKASAEFYEYVLGFAFEGFIREDGTHVRDWDDATDLQAADFRAGDTYVTLQLAPNGDANGASVEHQLEVINIDLYYRQVVDRNGGASELLIQPWGRKEFAVVDENGHSWTFYKPLPTTHFGT